ncbi:hypothetical protein DNTS_032783 [Danionella cerebrum]|nr:hypothetical protein DNTS_032783 [Danionella translucida]
MSRAIRINLKCETPRSSNASLIKRCMSFDFEKEQLPLSDFDDDVTGITISLTVPVARIHYLQAPISTRDSTQPQTPEHHCSESIPLKNSESLPHEVWPMPHKTYRICQTPLCDDVSPQTLNPGKPSSHSLQICALLGCALIADRRSAARVLIEGHSGCTGIITHRDTLRGEDAMLPRLELSSFVRDAKDWILSRRCFALFLFILLLVKPSAAELHEPHRGSSEEQ